MYQANVPSCMFDAGQTEERFLAFLARQTEERERGHTLWYHLSEGNIWPMSDNSTLANDLERKGHTMSSQPVGTKASMVLPCTKRCSAGGNQGEYAMYILDHDHWDGVPCLSRWGPRRVQHTGSQSVPYLNRWGPGRMRARGQRRIPECP